MKELVKCEWQIRHSVLNIGMQRVFSLKHVYGESCPDDCNCPVSTRGVLVPDLLREDGPWDPNQVDLYS